MIEFFATVLNAEDVPRNMPHCGILKANGEVKKAPIYGTPTGYCNSPACKVRSRKEREYHWYCPTQNDLNLGHENDVTRNYCECEKNEDRVNGNGRKILHYFDEDHMSGSLLCGYCYSFCKEEDYE